MIIHDEAVKKVLMDSGWSEGRKVDINRPFSVISVSRSQTFPQSLP